MHYVNSVMHALLLRPILCMHYVWRALLALFLVYSELFSNRELFTNHELCDTCTSAPPHVMHALRLANSAGFFFIPYCELFSNHELFTNHELLDE